jgi:hypothetical protein
MLDLLPSIHTVPAIAAELCEACFLINLLADDALQPWALEFFCDAP